MSFSTDYKITAFDQTKGQLTIKFDLIPHKILLDLHLDQSGKYLEGEQLDMYIRGIFPRGKLERDAQLAKGVPNAASILALVQKDVDNVSPTPQLPSDMDRELFMDVKLVVAIQQTLAEMSRATV